MPSCRPSSPIPFSCSPPIVFFSCCLRKFDRAKDLYVHFQTTPVRRVDDERQWLAYSKCDKRGQKTKTNTGARRVSAIKLSNRGKENVSEFFGNPFGTV